MDEVRLTLRIPAELKTELDELAKETRRSFNAMVLTIIERALEAEPFYEDLKRR